MYEPFQRRAVDVGDSPAGVRVGPGGKGVAHEHRRVAGGCDHRDRCQPVAPLRLGYSGEELSGDLFGVDIGYVAHDWAHATARV